MDVVWSKGLTSFAVSDVLPILEARRSLAYTTVMTTLARLHDKGVLARVRDGKRYLYTPNFSRSEFLHQVARQVLAELGEDASRTGAMALLVETVSTAEIPALDELERLVKLRRKALRT